MAVEITQLAEIEAQERAARCPLADATVDRTVLAGMFATAEQLVDSLSLVPTFTPSTSAAS